MNVPDSEDLDLPVRRYHSYSSMGIPDITGSGGSFTRRHGALGSPGCSIAGDKASLQVSWRVGRLVGRSVGWLAAGSSGSFMRRHWGLGGAPGGQQDGRQSLNAGKRVG